MKCDEDLLLGKGVNALQSTERVYPLGFLLSLCLSLAADG